MNRPIARLFALVIVMFAVLIAFTSRWTVFQSSALRANRENPRAEIEQERIHRGAILADDGVALARSVLGADGIYHRRYPTDELFAHAVGYSNVTLGQSALERSYNAPLQGARTSQLGSLLDQLQGLPERGNTVTTSLDPAAQRVALEGLAGRPGAVVALVPQTGAVKVFASVPGYDPNDLTPRDVAKLQAGGGAPLLDRVAQGAYPPGSTFKVVTTIAAIDSGRFTPLSVLNGDSPKEISGVKLENDNNQSYGNITLTTALTLSVNTVFAQVGVDLGKRTMGHYMNALGFNALPPIDLPPDELRASGEYYNGHLIPPTSPLVDVGRMAFGQDRLEVTPLQMAMVAAAVANGGVVMAPHLADRIVDPDGRTVRSVPARALDRAFSERTAAQVGAMMAQVVKEGTGTAAALSGIQVAGKTGTAQTPTPGQSQVWFIAYAPLQHPRYAVAVTIERSPGQGGTVAAPIARSVLESLLR